MKKKLLTIFALLISFAVYAQTTIEKPRHGASVFHKRITKIELMDTATVLSIHADPYYYEKDKAVIIISKETFIQPLNESQKLFVKGAEGILLNKLDTMPKSGGINFKLIFPKIDSSVSTIDYGETYAGETLIEIYDIQLKPELHKTCVPSELSGNWFNKENGGWELSLLDTIAIYKSQLWTYGVVKFRKGKGKLTLKNKATQIELFVKSEKEGNCLIGESPQALKPYCKDIASQTLKNPQDDKPYEAPVFKMDSVTYSGYIKGYTPRMGKTGTIHVYDILSSNLDPKAFLFKIAKDGSFSVKVPVYYPHVAWVNGPCFNPSVFLEPGKNIFQLIDLENYKAKNIFMGDCAGINADWGLLDGIPSDHDYEIRNKILEMSPVQYKEFCIGLKQKDLNALETCRQEHSLSAKVYQVKRLDIEYQYARYLMYYNWYFEEAYRKKNKIPWTQDTLPIKPHSLPPDYYDFITNELANNPLAVLSNNYGDFIICSKYLDLPDIQTKGDTTLLDLVKELEKSGYTFTEDENEMLKALKECNMLMTKEQKEFNEKCVRQNLEFYKKHKEQINQVHKEAKGTEISNALMEKLLIEKGVKFTEDEKVLWTTLKANENTETNKKIRQIENRYQNSMGKFWEKHAEFDYILTCRDLQKAKTENLKKTFGVQPGLVTDVMTVQDQFQEFIKKNKPISDHMLHAIQHQIATPFIAEYIGLCNKETKDKIEANKDKTDNTINGIHKAEADQLFDDLIKKYRGKVVFVDFWATTCGPCRAAIKQIKPLKEEMAKEGVVFVYITSQQSPQKTWEDMIPDIKGEHFRLTNDEWNKLKAKFNIFGIPHCVLVGKKGEVINSNLGYWGNASLKSELLKHVKE